MKMKSKNFRLNIVMVFTGLVMVPFLTQAQFTSGNLVVLQAGDGVTTLTNTGNPIIFKEYSPGGSATYSMAVPGTGTNALLISGSATSEGYLSLSADGKYLVFGGYVQALPNTVNLSGATASAVNRGVGLVGGIGLSSYSLMASSSSFFTSGNIRSAAAGNKDNIWAAGSTQGTNYFGPSAAATIVQNTKTNLRASAVFNGQLYCSSQVASGSPTDIGIYMIGTGTPVTSGQTASCAIITGTNSQPSQFYFNALNTICYVADARGSSSGGGIQKWVNSAGTWTLAYTLGTGGTAGSFGVVADFSGNNPKVYATTSSSGSNSLIAINDVGVSSTATVLATAPSNTNFRGLAFSPCSLPTFSLSSNSPICADQALMLTANSAGTNTYTWTGAGNISSPNFANPTINNAVSGVYTVDVQNNCGVISETIQVVVNPLPALQVNSITICTGQPATLTASGANTYTWSMGGNVAAVTVTPGVNTTYTVIGTSAAGCVNVATTQVIVTNSPSITVNSSTICGGASATLIANGVNTFTWNTNANTNSIVVTPASNTSYTVAGNLAGCPGSSSNTAMVTVNPSPTLSLSGSSVTCPGVPVTFTVSGADTYSWNFGSTASLVTVSPTITTTYSVTGYLLNGCSVTLTKTLSTAGGPPLMISSSSTVLCVGETATLSVTGASNYTWSTGGTGSIIAVSPTTNAVYTATGTIGTCKGNLQFTQNVDACMALYEELRNNGLSIFPNPVKDEAIIAFMDHGAKQVAVCNGLGRVVYVVTTSEPSVRLPLDTWPKGLYFVQVSFQNKTLTKKFVHE